MQEVGAHLSTNNGTMNVHTLRKGRIATTMSKHTRRSTDGLPAAAPRRRRQEFVDGVGRRGRFYLAEPSEWSEGS